MAEKLLKKRPDEDINRLGEEVDRFIREEANLDTAWLRTESHFGNAKFSEFKKDC